jgi:hypothetical protein
MLFREKLPIEDFMDGSIYRWQGPHPKFSPHTHEEMEMNLVTKGEGTYFIEGHKYKLKPFHQLWLFRDQLHILADSSSDFEMWVVVFKKGMVEDAWTEYRALGGNDQVAKGKELTKILVNRHRQSIINARSTG